MISAQKKGRILVIDDDKDMRLLLQDYFLNQGYDVLSFSLAKDALKQLQDVKPSIDLMITDLNMPEMNGLEFISQVQRFTPDVPIILITAFGSIETAIEAMRLGAYDYIVKPFKLSELSVVVERGLEYRKLKVDNTHLRKQIKKSYAMGDVIGKSPAMLQIFDLVQRVASAHAGILITGESGTGKEVIARAIHQAGHRALRPFIAINCTAIPETLLESELFGHAKGSFTGAVNKKRGLIEEANGGTLFLDEIGDMQPSLQSKLLRVIQEKKVRPVGENQDHEVDVRIIAATHKDLKAAIRDGLFREDLYYRLSVIPIVIPPLRERKEDIPLLTEHFLQKYTAQNNSPVTSISPDAMEKLLHLKWQGNVRELENIIERAIVLSTSNQITAKDLPDSETASAEDFYLENRKQLYTLEQLEKRYIEFILDKTAGRKERAAHILGINRKTLYRKEKQYGLNPNEDEPAD